ncbi:MAG: fibronectin type III domain-containing protein [Anaerolineaceae bacterium]
MFTSNLCNTMTRDLADLTDFGITAPKIAALKALGDAFEILPSDEVLVAYVIAATEAKTAKAELVKEAIRNMVTRCQIKWGVDSWQEKSLGVKGMNKYTDDTLLSAGRRVHSQMTTFLPDLADTGLTQAMLDDMDDLNEEFEVAKNSQYTKTSERENDTEIRINKGNEIYSLVSTYCEIGKRVYAKSDPVKYNEYVIYTAASPGGLTAPTNFVFDPITLKFTWDAVENATSYELQFSEDDITYAQLWTGTELEFNLSPMLYNLYYFRIRARNAGGFGPFSAVISYDFTTPLTAPLNLAFNPSTSIFSWSPVATATRYEFQYKHTEQVTWTSFDAGMATEYHHIDPAGEYLCRVRAYRNLESGPFSPELAYTVPEPG